MMSAELKCGMGWFEPREKRVAIKHDLLKVIKYI